MAAHSSAEGAHITFSGTLGLSNSSKGFGPGCAPSAMRKVANPFPTCQYPRMVCGESGLPRCRRLRRLPKSSDTVLRVSSSGWRRGQAGPLARGADDADDQRDQERRGEHRSDEPHRLRDDVDQPELGLAQALVATLLRCSHAEPPPFRRGPPPRARGYATQPPSGRSNHTWACPVPTEASYSPYCVPGARHLEPPSAPTMIK
jgi:hypothetical protein